MVEMPAIVAEDIYYRYRNQVALSGINLHFNQGVFGLLGPNGAGKTTFLNLLATAARPSEGSIYLLGYNPGTQPERKQIRRQLGYLPQHVGHFPDFTASEFVEYFALLKGVSTQHVQSAITRALQRVELSDQARRKLKALSGGQLQRVGIAQAIVNEPKLLLLDEPTAGLDPAQRVTFRSLLRELGEHSTVVVSTHLVEDVAAACSQVGVLSSGHLVFSGAPKQLAELGDETRAGDSPIERGYSATLSGHLA